MTGLPTDSCSMELSSLAPLLLHVSTHPRPRVELAWRRIADSAVESIATRMLCCHMLTIGGGHVRVRHSLATPYSPVCAQLRQRARVRMHSTLCHLAVRPFGQRLVQALFWRVAARISSVCLGSRTRALPSLSSLLPLPRLTTSCSRQQQQQQRAAASVGGGHVWP